MTSCRIVIITTLALAAPAANAQDSIAAPQVQADAEPASGGDWPRNHRKRGREFGITAR
jgi:hypothetical protein